MGLEEDVEIHVLTDKDTLDSRIVRFLDIYTDLSDHLSLEYTDPTVYPSALTEYGVEADTVVVTCEATGRQESFDVSDNRRLRHDVLLLQRRLPGDGLRRRGPADLRHRQRPHRRHPGRPTPTTGPQ